MMRTLLTGFGPFGSVVDNPTARIVAHFEVSGAAGHELVTRVLPVSFARAESEIAEMLHSGNFDAAVLLGVAGKRNTISLELIARNRDLASIPDADGDLRADVMIAPGRPESIRTCAKLRPLAARLCAAGLPARVSTDAGGYVCNHTYFAALSAIAESGSRSTCLFVHVPPHVQAFEGAGRDFAMPLAEQIRAVGMILEWLRENRR